MNRDFSDMLSALCAAGADFLVVGAYAMAAHGCPRATGDIDLWIRPTAENAAKVMNALTSFGAPLFGLTRNDLSEEGNVLQIGIPPCRIDLLTAIDGVTFDDAWSERLVSMMGGMEVFVLGRESLLRNKRIAGRPKDLVDVAWLEAHPPR